MWSPTYGDDIAGTENQIAPLGFELMRIGGYNNDANTPDPFNDAQLDEAVAYARAIGAEPIVQVPLIADTQMMPPTATTAADMVSYANVTKSYGISTFRSETSQICMRRKAARATWQRRPTPTTRLRTTAPRSRPMSPR